MTNSKHVWKSLFEHALSVSKLNRQLLFYCNFDIEQWKQKDLLSRFYQEVLVEWFSYNNITDLDKNQIIWYNKNILVQKQPVFYEELFTVGVTCIRDLYTDTKVLKSFAFWSSKGLKMADFLKWGGLVSSITKNIPKVSIDFHVKVENLNADMITYLDKPLITVTPKMVCKHLISLKCGDTIFIPQITKYTNLENIDWSIHYLTALTIPMDTRTREFQFKFLHDALTNNFWLKKWGFLDTDMCTFCKKEKEDITHLFWQCNVVQNFWQDFKELFYGVFLEEFNLPLIIYSDRNPLLCTLILLAKRYIYDCRYKNEIPKIQIYKWKLNYVKNVEFEIAKRNNKMLTYYLILNLT